MATKLGLILNSILGTFQGTPKLKEGNKPSEPVKHYTFMIRGEGTAKHVNIIAPDKESAEQTVEKEYPNLKTIFLWEYVRNAS